MSSYSVLLAGPLPPPTSGGIRSLLATLLPASWPDSVDVRTFDIGEEPNYQPGRITLKRIQTMRGQLRHFRQVLDEQRPDVVNIHASGGTGLAKAVQFVNAAHRLGVPIVCHLHYAPHMMRLFGLARVERYLLGQLSKCDVLIPVSDELASYLRLKLPASNIHVMPNCIDVGHWQDYKRRLDEKGTVRLLFVGTMIGSKGIFDLLNAFAASETKTHARLAFMGSDNGSGEAAQAQALAKTLGIDSQCDFLGRVYSPEKEQFFVDSDVFVLPSHGEGQPVSILEAMAARLPIIATRVGAVPEIVHDGQAGLLVELGDIDGLTSAIDQLSADAPARKAMGQRAYDDVAQYDVQSYISEMTGLFQHVIE